MQWTSWYIFCKVILIIFSESISGGRINGLKGYESFKDFWNMESCGRLVLEPKKVRLWSGVAGPDLCQAFLSFFPLWFAPFSYYRTACHSCLICLIAWHLPTTQRNRVHRYRHVPGARPGLAHLSLLPEAWWARTHIQLRRFAPRSGASSAFVFFSVSSFLSLLPRLLAFAALAP